MATEHVSSRFIDLDEWSPAEVIEAMWEGHIAAVASVRPAIGAIAAAVEEAVAALAIGDVWFISAQVPPGGLQSRMALN